MPVHLMLLDESVVHARKDSLGLASAGNFGAVRSSLSYIRRLMRFMEEERIEVLHTNSLKASILGGIAGRLSGVQVVWHIRDRIAADYLPAKVVLLMRQMAKVVPHFVIGNSLATLATLDLPRTPTAAIASGVDLGKFFSPEESGRGLAIQAQEGGGTGDRASGADLSVEGAAHFYRGCGAGARALPGGSLPDHRRGAFQRA